jgi:hypothetical protein
MNLDWKFATNFKNTKMRKWIASIILVLISLNSFTVVGQTYQSCLRKCNPHGDAEDYYNCRVECVEKHPGE